MFRYEETSCTINLTLKMQWHILSDVIVGHMTSGN